MGGEGGCTIASWIALGILDRAAATADSIITRHRRRPRPATPSPPRSTSPCPYSTMTRPSWTSTTASTTAPRGPTWHRPPGEGGPCMARPTSHSILPRPSNFPGGTCTPIPPR